MDETWWKFFLGVSRSFLNSSGTTQATGQILGAHKGKLEYYIYIYRFTLNKNGGVIIFVGGEVLVVVFVVLVLVLVVLGVVF